MQNTILLKQLKTNDYLMTYTLKEPSRTSDYDYDPDHPGRRFVSTYVHELEILDKITNERLIKINFSSETCGLWLSTLYRLLYTNTQDVVRTIRSIYVDGNTTPAILSIVKNIKDPANFLTFTFLHPKTRLSLNLNASEGADLINLLESEEIDEMYDFR